MKKLIQFIVFPLLCALTFSCKKECTDSGTAHPCDNNDTERVGCICADGTQSAATGSDACSGNGGVDYWLCNDCN